MRARKALLIAFAVALCCPATQAAAKFDVGPSINIAQWFTWPRYERAPATGVIWPPFGNKKPPPPTAGDLRALKAAGFRTIRLPVDPAPFFVLEGSRREAMYGTLFDALRKIMDAGLNVIVDLHPNSRHPAWGQHAMIDPESPAYAGLNDVIAEMGKRLSRLDQNRVALELMNEPRLKCKGEQNKQWETMLRQMVGKARQAAPKLTLVVTGACVSAIEGLLALDPEKLGDRNLIYTFHFYEPFAFTHQGAKFIAWPEKYLDEVPWPVSAAPIERPQALIDRQIEEANLDILAREKARIGANHNLKKYYKTNAGKPTIDQRFDLVAAWAREHGVAPDRILIGEFGVLRKVPGNAGALCADRMRWLDDVRHSANERHFTWSYFSYDGPFALVQSDENRVLDADVLTALGLKRGRVSCAAPD
jgi:hypothetical protein